MIYHNAHNYLLNPMHKITVTLIGCGGTGSQVLSILARMNKALMALDHLGLHVMVYDDDIISDANVGRQLYSASEVGHYKSISLISRINRFYGTAWEAFPNRFTKDNISTNIYISCVDEFDTRIKIGQMLKPQLQRHHQTRCLYWLDFGNTNNTGQAILGTLDQTEGIQMACFPEWASKYKKPRKTANIPSCSLAEALEKQDLLINSTLANAGMQLLWRLFREGKTPYRGIVLNLDTLTSNPIPV